MRVPGGRLVRAVDFLFDRAVVSFAAGTLALALVVMTLQIVFRYGLNASLVWAEELARYALIWSAMVGTSVAYRRAELVGVTYLPDRLPPRWSARLLRAVDGIVLMFSIVLMREGWLLTLRNFDRNQLTPALQIPIAWANLAIPAGGLLLGVAALEALLAGRTRAFHSPDALPE
jgi:TRAP-type C4-dicarboxylate transport system permease small subunit